MFGLRTVEETSHCLHFPLSKDRPHGPTADMTGEKETEEQLGIKQKGAGVHPSANSQSTGKSGTHGLQID